MRHRVRVTVLRITSLILQGHLVTPGQVKCHDISSGSEVCKYIEAGIVSDR